MRIVAPSCLALFAVLCLAASALASPGAATTSPWASTIVKEVSDPAQLKAVLQATDENSVFFVYDSADVNSMRVAPNFTAATSTLEGFASFYAIDMRARRVSWILDSWNVQIVPGIRGFSWFRSGVRHAWDKTPLRDVGAIRNAVEWPAEQVITPTTLKTFTLNLQGNNVPITRVDSDDKVQPLLDHVSQAGRPSVVLISNKGTSSQLYKAVAISFTGRCTFFEVNQARAPSVLKAFGVKNIPTLLAYDANGAPHVFAGDLNPTAIGTFVSQYVEPRAEYLSRKQADDNARISRETLRHQSPLLPVQTAEEWQIDVLDRQAITGIFFLDGASEATVADRTAVAASFLQQAGSRSTVTKFVWVDRSKSPKLYAQLTTVVGEEPAELVFVSTKRKVYQRFLGTVATQAIIDFVKGPMSRGVGSVSFEALPPFGQ